MNTHDKIELPEHDCLYETTNENGFIDVEPAYRKSTVLRLIEADRKRRVELADRKRRVEMAGWNPVDGNAHGYEGDIVLRHKNGEYRIGHSNWIESHLVQPYPPTKPKEAAYVGTLRMGYTSWMALDLPAPQPPEPVTHQGYQPIQSGSLPPPPAPMGIKPKEYIDHFGSLVRKPAEPVKIDVDALAQERADFEAWWAASDHFLSELDFCIMPDGRYEDDDVNVAWEAYQTGRATLQSQDAEDAERYRWLCDKFGITKLPCALERIIAGDVYVADGKAGIDEAIDHARRAEGVGNDRS